MTDLLEVVLPVFLVIGFGYLAAWRGLFSANAADGLMRFAQQFAIPCLLFDAIASLDLGAEFRADLLAAYYGGALVSFAAGLLGSRLVFGRTWPEAVAIGFCALFSNSVLLGLPITERAFGADVLRHSYAIIAIHTPFCYMLGVTAMELVRMGGAPLRDLPRIVANAMFRNAIVIGIGLGFVVNLTGLPVPEVVDDALDLMIRAALPAALFGLGGILVRYRPGGDLRVILWVCAGSLILHPSAVLVLSKILGLGPDPLRAAVLTAAMAPGINTYLFASVYGASQRVAASAVLIGTAASLPTVWVWLLILG